MHSDLVGDTIAIFSKLVLRFGEEEYRLAKRPAIAGKPTNPDFDAGVSVATEFLDKESLIAKARRLLSMNINFSIATKRGNIVPTHEDCHWQDTGTENRDFGFIGLVWQLWRWYCKVKVQARKAHKLRLKDRDMYNNLSHKS